MRCCEWRILLECKPCEWPLAQGTLGKQLAGNSLERNDLVGVGFGNRLADSRNQLHERGISAQTRPQREWAGKASNYRLTAVVNSSAHRGSHDDVILPGQTADQDFESGEHYREQIRLIGLSQRFQSSGHFRV